jgi:trimeric autotransporter adhesin
MSHSFFDMRGGAGTRASGRRKRRRTRESRVNQPASHVEYLEDRTLLSTVEVDVINFAFAPQNVTINVGDTIHWVWKAPDHSTTSVIGSAIPWDSGVSTQVGHTFDVTFDQAGTFNYYCKIHGFDNGNGTAGGMAGTITVQSAATLSSIEVTPANPSTPAGETQQFTATGVLSDNTTTDLTTQVNWDSSNTNVASISNSNGTEGLATALAQGTSTITASMDGISGTTKLTVTAPALESIAVTPAAPSVPAGDTEQFTATGTFSDDSTQDLTKQVSWASSKTGVATISNATGSQGLATAVATGTSSITAALAGVSGSTIMTVTAAVLQSIDLTPANPTIDKGLTEQLTATGELSDGTTEDLSSTATWASSKTSVATINATGLATAAGVGTSSITATFDGVTGSTVLTVDAAALVSIALTPANPTIDKGQTQQFTATGTLTDNTTEDLTKTATWASAKTSVATIDAAGLATAAGVGTSSITATFSGITGSTVLTVDAAALVSIALTPANPTIDKGQTQQFTATGTLTDNTTEDLTKSATWASAKTSVATIDPTGLATAAGVGTSSVTATFSGITGSTVLTVDAAALVSIALTPANPTIDKGQSQQFTATGTLTDNTTEDLTKSATWASSKTSVATIDATGLATAAGVGTSSITATFSGITGSTVLTVDAAALVSIAVTPASPTIDKGQTQQFTATGTLTDNTTEDLSKTATWASAKISVATIDTTGLATGAGIGTSSITATFSGITGSTVLTVDAAALVSIAVTPADPSISAGQTQQFTATGTLTDNTTEDLTSTATWASATTSVALISATGLATGAGTGTSKISATFAGITGSTSLTVDAATLVSIALTPGDPSIAKGLTQQFTATGTLTDNTTEDLTNQATWASATATVATIAPTGLATGAGVGTSKITATFDGITGNTVLTVSAAALVSIAVTPGNPTIAKGLTEQFTATGTLTDNTTEDLTKTATWASSKSTVATIDAGGLATGAGVGTSSITAAFSGMTGSTVLTVDAAALVSIAVTPSDPSISLGQTQQFTATGTMTDNTTEDLTKSATWASATTSVATISTIGLATGAGTGTSKITATLDGITGNTVLTVNAAALVSIAVTPANPSINKGLTHQFTATGTLTDNTTEDLTKQATWASATTSVATIDATGLATGAGVGTSSITATFSGITGSTVLTVDAAALVSIAVTPANPAIDKGQTEQFTATGTLTDNTTEDLTSKATWASATASVASISATGLATGAGVGTSSIKATFGGVSGTTVLTVDAAGLVSIAVTPAGPSIAKGLTEQFTATGTLTDDTTEDLTKTATWASATASVASIDASGLATGAGGGTSSISATFNGIKGTTTLTVTAAVLQSIAVTPSNPTISKGSTQLFVATGTFSDETTEDVTKQVAWSSSDNTVATISNTSGSEGQATAVAPGSATIDAMLDGVSGSTGLTVTAASLVSIAVTPAGPSVPEGELQIFKATGTFSDDTTEDLTTQVTWTSSNEDVATISNDTFTQGVATSLSPGTTTITAAVSGVTGSTVLTVGPAVLEMIMLSPTDASIAVGATESFMAMGMFSDNSMVDLTEQVTWSSSATDIATMSNAVGSQGVATALATGTTTITAALNGMTGITTLTVTSNQGTVLTPSLVVDNTSGGYYQYGIWNVVSGAGLNGSYATANPATTTPSAHWLATTTAGTYDIWASWTGSASNATNATYSIFDGFKALGTVTENQQTTSNDGQFGGVGWTMLGTFTLSSSKLTVVLAGQGASGLIVADGLLLAPSTMPAMAVTPVTTVTALSTGQQPGSTTSTPGPGGPLAGLNNSAGTPGSGAPSSAQPQNSQSNSPAINTTPTPVTISYMPETKAQKRANALAEKEQEKRQRLEHRKAVAKQKALHEALVARLARERLAAMHAANKHHKA